MRLTTHCPRNRSSKYGSTNLRIQRLIVNRVIRIIFIVPVFAVTSFLSVAFNDTSIYLAPLQTLYESFALSSFFFLLLAYVQEDDDEREAFFESSGIVAEYRVSIPVPNLATMLTDNRKLPSWYFNFP